KSVGGVSYAYNLRGDGQPLPEIVPPDAQRRALDAVLETVSPEVLALPRSVIAQIPPRPYRFAGSNELFRRNTGLVFDAVSPAAASGTGRTARAAERAGSVTARARRRSRTHPRTRRGTSHERFVPGRARADRRARLRRQPHAARGRRVDAAGEGDRGVRAGIASGCVRPARRRHRSSSARPAAGRHHRTVPLA